MEPSSTEVENDGGGIFPNTRWTLIQEISTGGEAAARALDELCGIYWYPVYAYLRGHGAKPTDAEDLTQSFFERLIGREVFSRADSEKGRLRCYLLHSLKHFKIDEHRKAVAQKRGGGAIHFSIDADEAEQRFRCEPETSDDPARIFERRWALALLAEAFERLKADYVKAGKAELYSALQPSIAGDSPSGGGYSDAATKLGMSTGAVQVAAHRMKKRYRHALEAAIAETVESPEEVRDELAHISRVLR